MFALHATQPSKHIDFCIFSVKKKYSNNSDKLQLDFFSELHVWGVFEIRISVPIKEHIM